MKIIEKESEEKIKSNYNKIKVSNLLKISGNQGTYQIKLLIITALIIYLTSFHNFYQPYIFQDPKFLCYDQKGMLSNCEEQEACKNPFFFEIKIERRSLITEYDLFCNRRYLFVFIQSFIFFAGALISFFFNYLSDSYSRKKILFVSGIFFLFGSLFCFSNFFYIIIFGLTLQIAGIDLITSMFYLYFNESMSCYLRNKSSGLTFLSFVFGSYSLAFICVFIKDYKDLFLIVLFTSILCIYFFWHYYEETPYLLYNKDSILNLYTNLKKISELNHTPEKHKKVTKTLKTIIFLDSQEDPENFSHLKPIKKHKNTLKEKLEGNYQKMILSSLLMMSVYFSSGMFLIAPQYMGIKSIFINITIPNIGEMIGYYTMSIFSQKFKRKKVFQFFLIMFYIFCSILFSFTFFKLRDYFFIQVLETFISFVLKMNTAWGFALIYTYIAEIFPTKIRGFATGFAILIGRISVSFCSFFVFWGNQYDFHPLFFCVLFAIIGQFSLMGLPETFGMKIKN